MLSPTDPKREPRSFSLSLARPLGAKRGRGERSFVLETRRQVVGFYGDLVENLAAWQPKAPKLSSKETPGEVEDPRRTLPGEIGEAATESTAPIEAGPQFSDESNVHVSAERQDPGSRPPFWAGSN